MSSESNSNALLLEILMAEIEAVILSSEKIQSRFRQISKMGILENIAHQNFGANLGDLAKAILKDADDKDSLPQPKQTSSKNNSRSEPQKSLPQALSRNDSAHQDNLRQNEKSIEGESHDPLQRVDGKKLSPDEIRFQEYNEKNFDEDKWLAKAKIDYP